MGRAVSWPAVPTGRGSCAVTAADCEAAALAVVVVSATREFVDGDDGGVRLAEGVSDERSAVVVDAESAVVVDAAVVDAESAVVVDDAVVAVVDVLAGDAVVAVTLLESSVNCPFSSMRPTFVPRNAAASELPASVIASTGV